MEIKKNKGLSIIIPCYNEYPEVLNQSIDEIRNIMNTVNDWDFEIIVVDDGSKKFNYEFPKHEKLKICRHEENAGYGRALKTGIKNSQYDWIAITDADGTYPNNCLPAFTQICEKYDMVVGSRSWNDISLIRRFPKMILTKFASYLANYKIIDLNSGMRVFRKEIALEFWKLFPSGFSFTSTITIACITNGYTIKYLPIQYAKRQGKSHINPIKDTYRFFSLVTRLTLYFSPLRVFFPLSVFFTLLAVGRGIRDYILLGQLGGMCLVLFFMAFQVFFFGLIAEIITKTRK